MPHMAGYCTCGRRMHWPQDTRYGDEWECYRCGTTWIWSRNGSNPMTSTRSRPPAPEPPAIVLPVGRETIRGLPPQGNQFIPPDTPRLPAPSRRQRPQPTLGCLPAFVALVGVGAGGVWWLASRLV